MEKYFKALDEYISLKIAYSKYDLENDLRYRREFHELANAKANMESQFFLLINKKEDRK